MKEIAMKIEPVPESEIDDEYEESLEYKLTQYGIQKRFLESSLDNYKPKTDAQEKALTWCREYCADLAGTKGVGAVFIGEPETGKTHLLCSILREYAKQKITVRYNTVEEFFLDLQETFGERSGSEKEIIDRYVKPQILVLDDLHHIKNADHDWQYKRLWYLLDKRYAQVKATLTSSNKGLGEIKDMLDHRTRRRLQAEVISVD